MVNLNIPFLAPVSLKDKAIFAKQLSVMLSAGLHLASSLEIIGKQSRNRFFREIIFEIHRSIEEGKSFSSLIARYPLIFDRVFVNIVRAGEQSGQLELVLKQLSKQLNQQYTFISHLRGALIYPVFVIFAMIGVGILATVKIVPQLKVVFDESKLEIPATTKVVIAISDFIINFWYIVIIVLGLLLIAGNVFLRTPFGRLMVDRLMLADPTKLSQKVYMARFARTLGMMLSVGIPIVDAVKVVAEVIGNNIYKQSLIILADDLERGMPMSLPLQKNPYFPLLVSQMILVGEQTGQLDQILLGIADFYEEESEAGIRNIGALFEPLIIVIIGVGIGFLVYSIIVPIYNLAQAQ